MPRKRPDPVVAYGDADETEERKAIVEMTARAGQQTAGRHDVSMAQRHNGTLTKLRTRARDGEPMRATTVHLPRELLRVAMIHCAARETTFSALVEQLLSKLLDADRRAG